MPDEVNPLPQEFASSEPLSESFSLLRTQVLERLKEESESGSTLDLILMERVSYMYAHIRSKEGTATFAHDRAYKETNQLLIGIIETLRKQRDRDHALDEARAELASAVIEDAKKALAFLEPEKRAQALTNLAEALGAP